jgi:hypothetical protein
VQPLLNLVNLKIEFVKTRMRIKSKIELGFFLTLLQSSAREKDLDVAFFFSVPSKNPSFGFDIPCGFK